MGLEILNRLEEYSSKIEMMFTIVVKFVVFVANLFPVVLHNQGIQNKKAALIRTAFT